jgi:hypothetical protein
MKTLINFTFLSLLSLSIYGQIIIPQGANWKYLDDGTNQNTAWYGQNFNDSSWSQGAAQLGYGDGDESTVISYGNSSSNKHITYYFRKSFNISNATAKNGIRISVLRDDGAVVYLNGTEIIRSNMPSGNIGYNTYAASTVAGSAENTFYNYDFPATLLNTGQNVIAVEVHQRSKSSSDVSFDLKMEFIHYSVFRKAPYLLYTGLNSEMLILWQLRQQKNCIIRWGTDTTYSVGIDTTQEFGNDHQHKIILTGLTPNTHYYYKVECNNQEAKTGDFISGADIQANQLSFYAYGDTRSYPVQHDSVARAILSSIAQYPVSHTLLISNGDIVADGDKEDDWDNQLFSAGYPGLQKMLATLPYLAAVGNHEGQGVLFAKYFPYPMFVNGQYYYSFDYGPVHFTVLDQYTAYSSGSAQYNWLVNDLSSTNKPWKIILMHKPGWSAGGGHSNSGTTQNTIQPLCLKYGVHFVIAGHNHYYARASVQGVQHITTGGGGAPLYTPNPNADSIVTVDKSLHFCKLDINQDTLTFSAVRADASLIESFKYVRDTHIGIEEANNNQPQQFRTFADEKTIVVQFDQPQEGRLEVYDNSGRRIFKSKINNTEYRIPIKTAGLYFVRFEKNGLFTVRKQVVQ